MSISNEVETIPGKSDFLLSLAVANIETSLNIFLMLLLGIVVSHPKIGYINHSMITSLSKVFVKVILPIFLFSKFAEFDFNTIMDASPAIFYSCFSLLIQFVVGWLAYTDWYKFIMFVVNYFCYDKKTIKSSAEDTRYIRTSRMVKPLEDNEFIPRNLLFLCIAFHSAFIIPLPYVSSIAKAEGIFKEPFASRVNTAFQYLSLHSFPVRILYYSFGIWVGGLDRKEKEKFDKERGIKIPLGYNGMPLSPKKPKVRLSFVGRMWVKGLSISQKALSLFPNSVYSMIFGLIVAYVPFLKENLVVAPVSIIRVFKHVTGAWSRAMSPLAFLIMGGNIGLMFFTEKEGEIKKSLPRVFPFFSLNSEKTHGNQNIFVGLWDFFDYMWTRFIRYNTMYISLVSVFGKLILVPIINLVVLMLVANNVPDLLIPDPSLRPLFFTVMMICSASPCMLSILVIGNSTGIGGNELSEVILLQYIVSPITVVIFIMVSVYVFCSYEQDACYM